MKDSTPQCFPSAACILLLILVIALGATGNLRAQTNTFYFDTPNDQFAFEVLGPGLPDPPIAAQIAANKPIELGTPLAIDLEATIELPAGATAQAPIGTTVNRDYATFTSKYSVQGNTLHASRSLHFISPELPASRATDFNAFLHAVQSDQTQFFTIQPAPQK